MIALSILLLQVLRDLEWIRGYEYSYEFCPQCDAMRVAGHDEDCALAAVLVMAYDEEEAGHGR